MRSSTSSSEARFVAAALLTFFALLSGWEWILRRHASAAIEFAIDKPKLAATAERESEWVVFGNCLMMTGVSPKKLDDLLADGRRRTIVNISMHEQSPIAFFEYLRRADHYPDVIVANVSSWLNGTNFEQEGDLLAQADPLGLMGRRPGAAADGSEPGRDQAFRSAGDLGQGSFQQLTERRLAEWAGTHVSAVGHRYHLFDYSMFLWSLVTSGSLDTALYQLNMQSWFTVTESETDGLGYLGLHVRYGADWSTGLDRMAERSLQRLRLSNLLTPRYWALLEEQVRFFQEHGTTIVFVRMPEHPKIRAFNEERYAISARMGDLERRTGAPVIDLSTLGPSEGVHLFDAVHPDSRAADVITREVGTWLRTRGGDLGKRSSRPRLGGG